MALPKVEGRGKQGANKEDKEREDELKVEIALLDKLVARISAASAAVSGDAKAVRQHADDAKLNQVLRARWLARAGDIPGALEQAPRGGGGGARAKFLRSPSWSICSGSKETNKKRFKQFSGLRPLASRARSRRAVALPTCADR